MNKDSKIFVAGHRGLVGSSIVRVLNERGYSNILTRTRNELNLLNQKEVFDFFDRDIIETLASWPNLNARSICLSITYIFHIWLKICRF